MLANAQTIRQAKADMRLEPLIKKVASNLYARNSATTMLQLGMEKGGGEGGFFLQGGTNLTARIGTRAYNQSTPSEKFRFGILGNKLLILG